MRHWLLTFREKNNLTQAQVAERAGIARTTYSMIEIGERGVSVVNAKNIASVLGFQWTIFFDDECHGTCTNDSKEAI